LFSSNHGDEIAWKSGATGGFLTFIGFSTSSHRGSIVLSNSFRHDPSGLGLDLINPDFRPKAIGALFHPLKPRRLITLSPEVLVAYVGTYTGSPAVGVTVRVAVRVRGSRLFVQATGENEFEDEFEAFPETETRFFVPNGYAKITFEKDAAGRANSLVVHHEDEPDWRAQRVQ
jgi:hypothetical protein